VQTDKILTCISEAVKNQSQYLQAAQTAEVQCIELHQIQTGYEICQQEQHQSLNRIIPSHTQ